MKLKITDRDLIDYVSGTQSKEEKRNVELNAIENDETGRLIHSIIINCDKNEDYADELLGPDDFDLEEALADERSLFNDSIFANINIKIYSDMISELGISNELVEMVIKAIVNHEADIASLKSRYPDMPLKEAGVAILKEKFDISRVEAEEIVDDLIYGMDYFDKQFQSTTDTGTNSLSDRLEAYTQKMNEEEKKECLVNVLTVLQTIHENVSAVDALEDRKRVNSEKDIEQLTKEINILFDGSFSIEKLADELEGGLDKETLERASKYVEINREEHRLAIALWLYIEQRSGHLNLFDDDKLLQARMTGLLSAAATEFIISTNEWLNKKTDGDNPGTNKKISESDGREIWMTTIKKILSIIAFAVIGIVVILAIANIGISFIVSIFKFLASALLLTLAAIVIGYVVAPPETISSMEVFLKIFPKVNSFYSTYLKPILNTAKDLVQQQKDLYEKMKEKSKELLKNGEFLGNKENTPSSNQANEGEEQKPIFQQPQRT